MKSAPFANPLIEPLPDTHISGLRLKSFQKSCVDFHWHFHPEIELICVEKGTGVRYVGQSIEPFSAGDLCLIGSNVPHAFGSHPTQRKGARWMVGHFLPEIWGEVFWRLPETRRIVQLLERSRHGLKFDSRTTAHIHSMLVEAEHTAGRASRLALWLEILDRLAFCHDVRSLNPVPFSETSTDSRLQKVLAWVETNSSEQDIAQAKAAAELGMSPQAFCRFFRQRTGRPFHRYVNEIRIARSCGELLSSDRPVSEIAFAMGFNNLANFNRRFREITGTTPREYRNIHGGATHGKFLTSEAKIKKLS